jgi:hypothetical protein
MDITVQKDLFGISISDSGKLYIRKFATVVRIVIFLGIILSVIHIAQVIIYAIKVNPAIYRHDSFLLFEHNIMPYYTAIYSILFFLQLYYYWKISNVLTRVINEGNDNLLNESFAALYHFAIYGMIIFILVLIFNLFDFYLTIRIHLY